MTRKWWIVFSLVAILLTSCSDDERDWLKTQVAGVSEPAIVKVEHFGATQMARVKGTVAPQIATRAAEIVGTEAADLKATAVPWIATEAAKMLSTQVAELQETSTPQLATATVETVVTETPSLHQMIILKRAQTWVDDEIAHDPGETHDAYRTDSSGYISYAWALDPPGLEPTRFSGDGYVLHIPLEQLQPGDILNNELQGATGHVVLFARWLDEEYTHFEAYDLSPGVSASIRELTLELAATGWTVAELNGFAPGPYYAQRLKDSP